MISILRWSRTPSWQLCQQYTISLETRKTSSVFSIYVMVALITVLGSLHLPRTAGHNLDEHYEDNVHRKKSPVIPAYEQRRSHGLNLPSWTIQKENNRLSPNRSTTNVKKRDRTDKSTLHPTKGRRRTTKDDAINTESHDAVTTVSFSPRIPSKGSLATKRKSMNRKSTRASFWKSDESSKETVSKFHSRSTPVTDTPKLTTIILGTTTVRPNQPVIDPHLSGEALLSVIARKSSDRSSDTSTRNYKSSPAKQDYVIDSQKSSWSPFSSTKFRRSHMPSTPTKNPPSFQKIINPHSPSFVQDSGEPIASTVILKRSTLTPIHTDKRISATNDRVSPINRENLQKNNTPNTGTSSPTLMTSKITRVERKRQRKKKGKNKKKRRKMKKTEKKKVTSNPQFVSTDKDIVPNTGQMSTTKTQAIQDQNEQRLETSNKSTGDSTGNPSSEINTSMMESKTSTSLQVPVHSDPLNEIDYPEITEGSVDDELARFEEAQSEFNAFRLDRNQKRLKKNNKKQLENRRLFRTGLPPDDNSESDLTSQTNRSPSVRRFLPKKRKGKDRDRNNRNNFFQGAEPTNFEYSESSGEDQIEKEFSQLQFAKISSVLKTTVKRSARPVDAITPIPDRKKRVTDSQRWKFQLKKRGNKTNESYIPNRETRVGDKTQSSSDSDPVKQLVVHSKGHSLFDHDGAAKDEHTKAPTMAELNKQTTDPASALYQLIEDNAHTQKSKTSLPSSEDKTISVNSSSPVSDGWQRSTQIGSHARKDTTHTTTIVYDSSKILVSVSLPHGEEHPVEKKVGLLVTQPPYSINNDTTQVPSHFSSRIIRGTDGSKSSQRLPATASSNRDHGQSSVYKKRKTGASTEKGVNVPLSSTLGSSITPVPSHTTKSPSLSPTEITPILFTKQSAESSTLSHRSAIEFTQRVTVSSRQPDSPANNTHVQNGFKLDAHSSSTPSTITTKDSSDSFNLPKEQRKTNVTSHDGVSVKERSTSISTRQESENASTPLSAIWTPSTPRSGSNDRSSETHSTNKSFPSTESTTTKPTVPTRNSDTDKSRFFVTSARVSDSDIKSIPHRVNSHDDQHYFLHPTTSSPPPFLSSSTSKSTSSVSSTTKSVKTRSYPTTKSSFSTSSSEDIHKMITTSPLVHRTTNTNTPTIQVSSVTNKRLHNQHLSTKKPFTKQPQSATTEATKIPNTTSSVSPTKSSTTARKIDSGEKTSKDIDVTTKKSIKGNPSPTSTLMTESLATTPEGKTTKKKSASDTTLPINSITNVIELHSTPGSVSPKPKDDQSISSPPLDSSDYEELLVKCKVKSNIDINGNDFLENIKNGLVYSYLEGRTLLNQRKAGSTNKRRKRETIDYVLEQNIDTHAVHFDDTEGIEAKILDVSRRDQLVEINFQMLEYGIIIATDTAIEVFSQLQITEISVNLHYPIYHQIEAIKHVMFQSQQPLKPSTTKWMMVTIAAPSIPVLCVICILLTSWYRNHARLRRKAMAEISRGSQYAESLADVGLEIDMEKGEIVSRAGSTSVLWTEFAAGDTLERMGMAGDFPKSDGDNSSSGSWNARGETRTGANQSGRGRRLSPVARQCQRNGKYVKKKDSISSFHFENNLEDEWLGCLLSTDYTDPMDLKNEWLQLQTFQKYNQQTNNEQNRSGLFNPLLD